MIGQFDITVDGKDYFVRYAPAKQMDAHSVHLDGLGTLLFYFVTDSALDYPLHISMNSYSYLGKAGTHYASEYSYFTWGLTTHEAEEPDYHQFKKDWMQARPRWARNLTIADHSAVIISRQANLTGVSDTDLSSNISFWYLPEKGRHEAMTILSLMDELKLRPTGDGNRLMIVLKGSNTPWSDIVFKNEQSAFLFLLYCIRTWGKYISRKLMAELEQSMTPQQEAMLERIVDAMCDYDCDVASNSMGHVFGVVEFIPDNPQLETDVLVGPDEETMLDYSVQWNCSWDTSMAHNCLCQAYSALSCYLDRVRQFCCPQCGSSELEVKYRTLLGAGTIFWKEEPIEDAFDRNGQGLISSAACKQCGADVTSGLIKVVSGAWAPEENSGFIALSVPDISLVEKQFPSVEVPPCPIGRHEENHNR